MEYRCFNVGPLATNSYLVWDASGAAVLIDPAGTDEKQLDFIRRKALRISALLATHAHADHIHAARELSDRFSAPLYMHESAEPLREFYQESCVLLGYPVNAWPSDYRPLGKVDVIPVGAESLTVLRTPGHSPCGVTFLGPELLFSGDLLFKGSIGRYDLPFASLPVLYNSLKKVKRLQGPYTVLPGHGPATTLEEEIRSNEYLATVR